MENRIHTLDTPIQSLPFSRQTSEALQRSGIRTVGMLLATPEKALMELHGLNTACRKELTDAVKRLSAELFPSPKELYVNQSIAANEELDHLTIAYLHTDKIYTAGDFIKVSGPDLDQKLDEWYGTASDQEPRKQNVRNVHTELAESYEKLKEVIL